MQIKVKMYLGHGTENLFVGSTTRTFVHMQKCLDQVWLATEFQCYTSAYRIDLDDYSSESHL